MSQFVNELQKAYKKKEIEWDGYLNSNSDCILVGRINGIKFEFDGDWPFVTVRHPFFCTINIPLMFNLKLRYQHFKLRRNLKQELLNREMKRKRKAKENDDELISYIKRKK